MRRRPFLKNLTALSGSLAIGSFSSLSAKEFLDPSFAPKFRIVTASDGHFGEEGTNSETSHKNLIEAINGEKDLDFVVLNGDLIHDKPEFMPRAKAYYEQLNAPYFVNKGNHDRVSPEVWEELFGQTEDYSFVHQEQIGILLLNCSNIKGEYLCANLEYAEKVLSEYKSLPQVLVFIHISQNDWTRHGIVCDEFLSLLSQYPNVKATFHGHDHDVDGIMWNRKKPYFWSGHFGGSWGNPNPSYRIIEINEEGKIRTALKTVADSSILNAHQI